MLGQSPPQRPAVGVAQGLRPPAEVLRRGGFHGGSRVKHGNPVGKMESQVDVVGDEHHGLAGVGQVAEHLQGLPGLVQTHPRSGLVGDDEPGSGQQGRGDQNPPGHAAGELKGIQPLRLLRKAEAPEQTAAFFRGTGLPVAVRLRAHLHQGIQKGNGLGHQGNFTAPKLSLPVRGQRPAVKAQPSLHPGVVRQNPQNGGGQQAFSRAGGAGHRQNLPGVDRQAQAGNDLEPLPGQAAPVHLKRNGQVRNL